MLTVTLLIILLCQEIIFLAVFIGKNNWWCPPRIQAMLISHGGILCACLKRAVLCQIHGENWAILTPWSSLTFHLVIHLLSLLHKTFLFALGARRLYPEPPSVAGMSVKLHISHPGLWNKCQPYKQRGLLYSKASVLLWERRQLSARLSQMRTDSQLQEPGVDTMQQLLP